MHVHAVCCLEPLRGREWVLDHLGCHIQVRVVIGDRKGQRFGGLRPVTATGGAHSCSARRASSSSTIESSNLVKIGVGAPTGVPGAIFLEAHGRIVPASVSVGSR